MSNTTLDPVQPTGTLTTMDRSHGERLRAGHNSGFWFVGAAFLLAMAFSTVSTPLYPIYQRVDGFSSFMVTVVFAVYAVGVVLSLILFGHVSDWVGRRRMLLRALAVELAAAVVFVIWTDLPGLLVARFVTGVGVGMITATATAHLGELNSRSGRQGSRFEFVSTAANIGGLGVGPLVAGALAQWAPAPLRTPYLVFAVLLVLAAVAVLMAPETVPDRRAENIRYRPQRIALAGDRRLVLGAMAGAFAAFAVFGMIMSMTPTFIGVTLGHPARILIGAVIFAVYSIAALSQVFTRSLTAATKLTVGLAAEATGLVLLNAGLHLTSMPVFLLGSALAGAGAGVLFKAALGTVAGQAEPARRGEALAGLFLVAYLGLIVPVVGLGLATLAVPVSEALAGFSVVLLILLAAVGITGRRSA